MIAVFVLGQCRIACCAFAKPQRRAKEGMEGVERKGRNGQHLRVIPSFLPDLPSDFYPMWRVIALLWVENHSILRGKDW